MYAGLFDGSQSAKMQLDPKRKGYVHLIKGSLTVNGQKLASGDALLMENESALEVQDGVDAEVLFFDLSH
jgi:redox-sensitive bicupin YhaK (pirin superfamily)